MKKIALSATFLSFVVIAPATAATIADRLTLNTILGGNQSLEDFERFTNTTQISSLQTLNAAADWAGQGTDKVVAGISFAGLDGQGIVLNPDGYYGLPSHTLGGYGANRYQISFTAPVTAFGMDLKAYAGYGSLATITVYDLTGLLIHTATVSGGATVATTFFGFENAAGISRLQISDAANTYTLIDNIGFGEAVTGPVPEPATWLTMLAGFVMIAGAVRYRRRATQIVFG